jgi:L-cysteine S-thiosulfotransferase
MRRHLIIILTASAALALSMGSQVNAQSAESGFRIMFDQRGGNCAACHSIADALGKKSGTQSTFAPPLDGVASRYSKAQLVQWVTDARQLKPQTLMPPFGVDLNSSTAKGRLLTDSQIADVVAALETLR